MSCPRKILLPMLILALTCLSWGALAQEKPGPIIEGRGEFEMVLVHGLGASNEIWEDSLPYLKGTFKVWTFEMAGHGNTQPIADPTIEKEAARLAEFLRAEDIVYPTLVGHGLGGMVALEFALDHPADVHRLIMIDSAPKQLATEEQKAEVGLALVENYDQFVFNRYSVMSPEQDITEIVVDMALRTHAPTFTGLLMSSFDYDVTDRLHEFTVPLLVVGSELLFPNPETSQQVLHQIGFGKARSLTFKRLGLTGHYVMMERPPYTASVLMAFGVTSDYSFGQ